MLLLVTSALGQLNAMNDVDTRDISAVDYINKSYYDIGISQSSISVALMSSVY